MEIYTYGNTDAVLGVLHALVMLFGSDDYLDIVRVCIVIGFIVAASASVMQQTHRGWTWLIGVMVVYAIFFIPKTTVIVMDKLSTDPPVAVANVPWAAGFLFSIKSQIGHTLVRLAETALQTIPDPRYRLPSELTYEANGVAFGSRLIRESRAAVVDDVQLRGDIIAYVRNCVFPEIGKSIAPDTIAWSGNLWSSVAVANPALVTPYTPLASIMTVSPCPDVYALISARLPVVGGSMLERLAVNVKPGLSIVDAVAAVGPALESAYTKNQLSAAATSASDILLHNALINHFGEAGQVIAASSSDPAALLMSMAKSQATAQTNASYLLQARQADEATPIVRNTVEAFLLGFFPVVCLLLLVTEGKRTVAFFIGYVYALVWIELWPFTYAILNFVHSTYAAREVAASAFTGAGNALTLMTSGIVYSTALSTAAVTGWMILFVPTLSAALLWGFDKIVGAVPSISSMLGQSGAVAANAAAGNLSIGNMGFDKHALSPQKTSALFTQVQSDRTGDTYTTGIASGVRAVSQLQNTGYLQASRQMTESVSLAQAAGRSEAVALQESVSAQSETVAGMATLLAKGASRSTVGELGKVVGSDTAKSDAETWRTINTTAKEWQRTFKLSEQQAYAMAVSAHGGVEFGLSMKMGASVGLRGGVDASQRAALERAYGSVQKAATTDEVGRTRDFVRRMSSNEQYRNAVISNQGDRQEVSATFQRAAKHAETAQAAYERRDELSRRAEVARQVAIGLGYNELQDPKNTGVLEQLADAERLRPGLQLSSLRGKFENLREQTLSVPQRHLDGSTVATDPKQAYERASAADPALVNRTEQSHAEDRARLGPLNVGSVGISPRLAQAEASVAADPVTPIPPKHGTGAINGPKSTAEIEAARKAMAGKVADALQLQGGEGDDKLRTNEGALLGRANLVPRAAEAAADTMLATRRLLKKGAGSAGTKAK